MRVFKLSGQFVILSNLLTVLYETIPAAVDFVIQSWKKESKCFGQHSHCDRRMWTLGLAHRCDVYIVLG